MNFLPIVLTAAMKEKVLKIKNYYNINNKDYDWINPASNKSKSKYR